MQKTFEQQIYEAGIVPTSLDCLPPAMTYSGARENIERFAEAARAEVRNEYEDKIGRWQIDVEKLLCDILGRPWAPSGFSIEALCADIKARLATTAEAMEMALCESHSVVLREGQLYRFLRVGDCEKCAKMSADSLECYGPPPTATVEAKPADPDPSGLIALLETDVLWHARRGNDTIATDIDRAIAELKRLYRNSGEVEAPEVEDLISSTWFANRPAVLDAIRAAGMTLEHYNGLWKLRPLRDGW